MLTEISDTDKLLDAIDTLLLVLDAEGRVASINQVGCELTGYTTEEAVGQTFWHLCFPSEEGALVQQLFKEVAHPPHQLTHEHLWRGKTGQARRVSFTIAALYHQPLELSGYVVTGLDVTDLRRTEHELWEYRENLELQVQRRNAELVASEARLAGILDTAEDAVVSIDSQQRVVLFNHGAEKIFGYSATEILGEPLDTLLPKHSRKSHTAQVKMFGTADEASRRMSERTEIFGQRKDGTEFDAEASISKLDLKGQRIYTAFLRDISERKRMEQKLRDHERWLDTVLSSVGDGVVTVNLFGAILTLSPVAEQLCGCPEAQAQGKPVQEVFVLEDGLDTGCLLDQLDCALLGKTMPCLEKERPVLSGTDEQRRIVDIGAAPLRDAAGAVTGAVLTFRDISARYQAELVLAEARDTFVKLLTPRENEVLQLMVDGFSTKEIASDFNISPRTVESHRQNMMRKFGLHDMPMLIRFALIHHLVEVPPGNFVAGSPKSLK